jgi:hypothetical protein
MTEGIGWREIGHMLRNFENFVEREVHEFEALKHEFARAEHFFDTHGYWPEMREEYREIAEDLGRLRNAVVNFEQRAILGPRGPGFGGREYAGYRPWPGIEPYMQWRGANFVFNLANWVGLQRAAFWEMERRRYDV